MKHDPCNCCKARNKIPTSRRGFCARCQEVITVIDYLVAEEKAEQEKVATRRASGLVLPEELRGSGAR